MKFAFVFYYKKTNRYSYNAIIAALETSFIENYDLFIPSSEKELIKLLNDINKVYSKIILTISFFTTQVWEINKLLKKIKTLKIDNLILLAGGPHSTGEPEKTLKLGFDYVLTGEGEITFPETIKKILNDENLPKIIYGKRVKNLDDFNPFPIKKIKKFGPIEITRGCPFFCNFCQTSRIFGGKPRHRSIDKICKIVEYMKIQNRVDIRFIMPDAFSYGSKNGKEINLNSIENLLKEIRKILNNNGRIFLGSFPSEVRPEHVIEDTVLLVKKYCNNDNLVIGGQSGSEKILKICNRRHTVKDIYNAVKICTKFNLTPNIDFIFGLPGEDEKDIKDTIKVMKDIIKMGARIHAHTFMPLPQTPFKDSPPGKISKLILKEFKYSIPKGIIFGNYVQQEILAQKIYEYLKFDRL